MAIKSFGKLFQLATTEGTCEKENVLKDLNNVRIDLLSLTVDYLVIFVFYAINIHHAYIPKSSRQCRRVVYKT